MSPDRLIALGDPCSVATMLSVRRPGLFITLLPVLISGCETPAPDTRHSAIIGGTIDSGDPAVALLVSFPPDRSDLFTCTAVLVGPTVFLTAAHCVDPTTHVGHTFGLFLGHDASAYPTAAAIEPHLVPVASAVPHPDYQRDPPFSADIAVVTVAAPVSISPLPMLRTAPTDLVGHPARIVGYGQTVYGTFNAVKHTGTTTLAAIDPGDTITVGDANVRSCIGDSGGPALSLVAGVETVVGINSYSDTTGCVDPAHYRRVDLYLSFIEPYLATPDGGASDASAPDAAPIDAGVPDGDTHDGAPASRLDGPAGQVDAAQEGTVRGDETGGCAIAGVAEGTPGLVGSALLLLVLAGRPRRLGPAPHTGRVASSRRPGVSLGECAPHDSISPSSSAEAG